jgi:hypothetical protein
MITKQGGRPIEVVNISSAVAFDGDTKLTVEWNDNEGIKLSKTTSLFDGVYVILTLVSAGLDP